MRGMAVVSRTSSLLVRMAVSRIVTSRLTLVSGSKVGKKEDCLLFRVPSGSCLRRSRLSRALISWVTGDCRIGVWNWMLLRMAKIGEIVRLKAGIRWG